MKDKENGVAKHSVKMRILSECMSQDFYKTGQFHNDISDAMEEYLQEYKDKIRAKVKDLESEILSTNQPMDIQSVGGRKIRVRLQIKILNEILKL